MGEVGSVRCHIPWIFVIAVSPTSNRNVGNTCMLQNLSAEIRQLHQNAEECDRQARTAPTETLRADYLRNAKIWLRLARSYEFQERLTRYITENSKRENAGDRGLGQPDNDPKRCQNQLIAIVDDDPCARAGLQALIESRGHSAVTFASAEEYLGADMTARAACLILDVHLPGMSGPDLQAHLTASARCPPTIFATGRFDEHVRKRVTETGALAYLIKPCNERALFDCIGKVFAQQERCEHDAPAGREANICGQ